MSSCHRIVFAILETSVLSVKEGKAHLNLTPACSSVEFLQGFRAYG
jgi:hypothetical protein